MTIYIEGERRKEQRSRKRKRKEGTMATHPRKASHRSCLAAVDGRGQSRGEAGKCKTLQRRCGQTGQIEARQGCRASEAS